MIDDYDAFYMFTKSTINNLIKAVLDIILILIYSSIKQFLIRYV
jgi:hypothetical protein